MKKTNLSWVGALLVFALLLWCTAATPGTIADPASYTPAVYSSMLSLLPPVVAIVLTLNTKEVSTPLLVAIATGALLFANGNLELADTTLFFNEDGGTEDLVVVSETRREAAEEVSRMVRQVSAVIKREVGLAVN